MKTAAPKQPKKRRAGRPDFKPTVAQRYDVRMMAAAGVPADDMCLGVLKANGEPISPKTLRKHFRAELDTGMMRANITVIGNLYKNATEPCQQGKHGNPILQIFWAKTRLSWRDRSPFGGYGGAPPPDAPPIDEDLGRHGHGYEFARRVAFVLDEAIRFGPGAKPAQAKQKKREPA